MFKNFKKAKFVGILAEITYNDYTIFNFFIDKKDIKNIKDIIETECFKKQNSDEFYFVSFEAVFTINKNTSKEPLSKEYPFMYLPLKKTLKIKTPIENIPQKEIIYKELQEKIPNLLNVNNDLDEEILDKMIILLKQLKKGENNG